MGPMIVSTFLSLRLCILCERNVCHASTGMQKSIKKVYDINSAAVSN